MSIIQGIYETFRLAEASEPSQYLDKAFQLFSVLACNKYSLFDPYLLDSLPADMLGSFCQSRKKLENLDVKPLETLYCNQKCLLIETDSRELGEYTQPGYSLIVTRSRKTYQVRIAFIGKGKLDMAPIYKQLQGLYPNSFRFQSGKELHSTKGLMALSLGKLKEIIEKAEIIRRGSF